MLSPPLTSPLSSNSLFLYQQMGHLKQTLLEKLLTPFPKNELQDAGKAKKMGSRWQISVMDDELLSFEQIAIKERILRYLETNNSEILGDLEKRVISIFIGEKEIDEIKKIPDWHKALEIVKIIDIALAERNRRSINKKKFIVSSYTIRSKFLEDNSIFSTSDVFTKTVDPRKLKNRNYLKNPNHWITERVGQHAKLIANQYIKTRALSQSLAPSKTTCFVIRAPTGGGKTHFIKEHFKTILDGNGNLAGVLNPDEIKFSLKQLNLNSVNIQVHQEGVVLFQTFKDGIKNKALNVIMEGRFSSIEEMDIIFEQARQKSRKIFLVDIAHASLSLLLKRILARDPTGKTPVPLLLKL